MDPKLYTSEESSRVGGLESAQHAAFSSNRFLVAIAAFLSAAGAFYFSLAVNVFVSPFMHEQISPAYFLNWWDWAVLFAAVCTSVVVAASFLFNQIEHKHFLLLLIPFAIELALTFRLFVACFGV